MKLMIKRTLSLLFFVLLMSLFSTVAFANGEFGDAEVVQTVQVDNLTFTLYANGCLTIEGSGAISDNLFSEDTLQNFLDCEIAVKSLIIEDGILAIGSNNFYWASNLETVSLAESITSIGDYAFSYCISLKTINLPNNLAYLGTYAFCGCRSLESISIPSSLSVISDGAFSGCTGLKSVLLPEGITTIGKCTFAECANLTGIAFPNSLTTLDYNAFLRSGLTSITIPNTLTSIDNSFCACTNLKEIHISNSHPAFFLDGNGVLYSRDQKQLVFVPTSLSGEYEILHGVTKLAYGSFLCCVDLTDITIPDSVLAIDGWAFAGCTGLESIFVPDSVSSIAGGVFSGCNNLSYARVPAVESGLGIGSPFSECKLLKTAGPIGGGYNVEFACEGKIPNYMFGWFSGLANVTIPGSVETVGNSAFNYCSGLNTIYIPIGVTSIEDEAFNGCYNLKNIYYEGDVEDWTQILIGANNEPLQYAIVYYNSPMNTFLLGEGSCGDNLTWTLDSNGLLTISGTGPMYDFDSPDFESWQDLYNSVYSVRISEGVTTIGNFAFSYNPGRMTITEVTIPESVTSIGEYAFGGCSNLTEIILPESLSVIGAQAFDSTGLQRVVIPSHISTIPASCFSSCQNLWSIILNNGLKSIDQLAFQNTAIGELYIPDTVENISPDAFYNCRSLYRISVDGNNSVYCDIDGVLYSKDKETLVRYPGGMYGSSYDIPPSVKTIGIEAFSMCGLTAVSIPEGVTTIHQWAFHGCTKLRSIVLPDSVTYLSEAFRSCTGLTDITISNNLYMIGDSTFENCTSLTHIEIPASVKKINYSAFRSCSSLESITINNSMKEIERYAFSDCSSLSTIYFIGTEDEWNAIEIGEENEPLLNATVCFNPAYPDPSQTLTLPAGLSRIENEAFSGVGAQTIVIPASVCVIEPYAFADCPNLAFLYFEGSPNEIAYSIVLGCKGITVYVLRDSSAETWARERGYAIRYHD